MTGTAKLITGLACCAGLQAALAQTNITFQNCQPGDIVRVRCDHPDLVLSRATLREIGSNTVTVCTANDRFTLDKTNVVLVPVESHLSPAAEGLPVGAAVSSASAAASNPSITAAPMANIAQTMETIRASVIDPHKMEAYKEPKLVNGKWEMVIDPNSTNGQAKNDKANAYYHQTMNGVMNGSVSQAELVRQAKEILAACDKYQKERADDPQYEEQIKTLRDFVRRSEAGEKFDFQTPTR
jgi:hypothetical protein